MSNWTHKETIAGDPRDDEDSSIELPLSPEGDLFIEMLTQGYDAEGTPQRQRSCLFFDKEKTWEIIDKLTKCYTKMEH